VLDLKPPARTIAVGMSSHWAECFKAVLSK
jgi:hypothetical protein